MRVKGSNNAKSLEDVENDYVLLFTNEQVLEHLNNGRQHVHGTKELFGYKVLSETNALAQVDAGSVQCHQRKAQTVPRAVCEDHAYVA